MDKEGKNGKFMGLAVSPKDESYVSEKQPSKKIEDMESDAPF